MVAAPTSSFCRCNRRTDGNRTLVSAVHAPCPHRWCPVKWIGSRSVRDLFRVQTGMSGVVTGSRVKCS